MSHEQIARPRNTIFGTHIQVDNRSLATNFEPNRKNAINQFQGHFLILLSAIAQKYPNL